VDGDGLLKIGQTTERKSRLHYSAHKNFDNAPAVGKSHIIKIWLKDNYRKIEHELMVEVLSR
jgi:hypothetical protein